MITGLGGDISLGCFIPKKVVGFSKINPKYTAFKLAWILLAGLIWVDQIPARISQNGD